MERFHQSIGARVNEERTRQGLSLRQLAAKSGLSASMLCMIEKGTTNPSVDSLFAIAEALGLPLSHFFQEPSGSRQAEESRPSPASAGPVLRAGDRPAIELT